MSSHRLLPLSFISIIKAEVIKSDNTKIIDSSCDRKPACINSTSTNNELMDSKLNKNLSKNDAN